MKSNNKNTLIRNIKFEAMFSFKLVGFFYLNFSLRIQNPSVLKKSIKMDFKDFENISNRSATRLNTGVLKLL